MPKMRHMLFLACAMPALGVCLAGSVSAQVGFGRGGAGLFRHFSGHSGAPGAGPARTFAVMRNHGFNHLPGGPAGPIGQAGHGVQAGHLADHAPGANRSGRGFPHGPQHSVQHGPQHANQGQQQRTPGRDGGHPGIAGQHPAVTNTAPAGMFARNGLPRRPFPGEAGFTGVPPRGESRFISHEMVVHVGADVSAQTLEAAARRLGMTAVASQDLALSGGRLVHFQVRGDVSDAIRSLESEKLGIAQPNYLFQLQEDVHLAALAVKGDPAQYVIDKLHLREAHAIASGANVTVAVIDSLIDRSHPDLVGSVAGQYDAVSSATDKPDEHGTGMTGAIAAHRRLLGVAPQARILAIHAFTPDAKHPQQATTQSIVAGIDWAIKTARRLSI